MKMQNMCQNKVSFQKCFDALKIYPKKEELHKSIMMMFMIKKYPHQIIVF